MPKSDLDFAFKKMSMLQMSMQSCKQLNIKLYYMAMSQKDWKQSNSRIWLAKIDLDHDLINEH